MSRSCDTVQKKNSYGDFINSNPGHKLVYREFTSVTSMHEKKQDPYKRKKKKKVRCQIFTNSYKNINMNKLISSTFPYCTPFYCLVFPTNGRETCQMNRRLLCMRQRRLFIMELYVLCHSDRESVPALSPHTHPCHQRP